MKYDYPGNVRELENIVERAVVISRDQVIAMRDLPFREVPMTQLDGYHGGMGTLKEELEMVERRMITQAMEETNNNQTKAAELLGISERMLRYKLKKTGSKH